MTREFLGLGTDNTGIETGGPAIDAPTSGGLSINVGDFLEIKPGDVPEDDNYAHYYDGGKVNVRINTEQGFKNIDNRINLDILDKTLYFVGSHLSVRYDRLHGIDSERHDDQLISGLYVKLAERSGLNFNGTGEIIISLDDKKGIDVDENGNLFVKAGDGVSFDENGNLTVNAVAGGNSLTFTDANGNNIVYKPSNEPVEITLGRGLQITE